MLKRSRTVLEARWTSVDREATIGQMTELRLNQPELRFQASIDSQGQLTLHTDVMALADHSSVVVVELVESTLRVRIDDFIDGVETWTIAASHEEPAGGRANWSQHDGYVVYEFGALTDPVEIEVVARSASAQELLMVWELLTEPSGALYARSDPSVSAPVELESSLLRVFHPRDARCPVVVMTRPVRASASLSDCMATVPARPDTHLGEAIALADIDERAVLSLLTELGGTQDVGSGSDPGAYLNRALKRGPRPDQRSFADTLYADYQLPLAQSPSLFVATLRELLRSPKNNAIQAAFMPIMTGGVASSVAVWNGDWLLALKCPIAGVGASFIVVTGVWILHAIADKPAWPEDEAARSDNAQG